MSTGIEIIKDALGEIGQDSEQTEAQAIDLAKGLRKLNSMLAIWETWDIDMKITPIDVAGDELSEPLDARNGIVQMLALELAPPYANGGNIVSPQLQANANRNFEFIRGKYGIGNPDRPKRKVSSTLPRGAGNTRGFKPQVFYDGGEDNREIGSS